MHDHAELTRRVRFDAEHRYHRPDWSAARNAETFGAQVEPHGHTFTLEVTVRGPVDPDTGFCVDLAALDRELERLVAPLRGALLNEAVPAFRGGAAQPSTEALARWAWGELQGRVPGSARLVAVRVAESDDLWATWRG